MKQHRFLEEFCEIIVKQRIFSKSMDESMMLCMYTEMR